MVVVGLTVGVCVLPGVDVDVAVAVAVGVGVGGVQHDPYETIE